MTPGSAADTLGRFIYGNVPIEDWGPDEGDSPGEPWTSFAQARTLWQSGDSQGAVTIWQNIASMGGIESRQTLQAWHFLRSEGVVPEPDVAKLVLGVLAEVPVQTGHDVLAGYRDGSVRYLNYSGKAAVVEDRSLLDIQNPLREWLAVAQEMVGAIGPWVDPKLPTLPAGHLRVMMLTPSGPHFGQGPNAALSSDPAVARFLNAAVKLLKPVVQIAT